MEQTDYLIKQGKKALLWIVLALILLQIVFYKESVFTVAKLGLSLVYLYYVPLFPLAILFFRKESFLEQSLMSVVSSVAVVSILSYYLALFVVDFNYHHLILPPVLFLIGLAVFFKYPELGNSNKHETKQTKYHKQKQPEKESK